MAQVVYSRRYLLEARYASTTHTRYSKAVTDFVKWCVQRQQQQQQPIAIDNAEQLDNLLADYVHYLHFNKLSKQTAINTAYGLRMYLPQLRHGLPITQACLTSWCKIHPPQSHPPLAWELTVLVACAMCRLGRPRLGVATLLAFHCLLRVGELLSLRKNDIADTGDLRFGSDYKGMCLRLRVTKTGKNQFVTITDPSVQHLLRLVINATLADDGLLFPVGAPTYRALFKRCCALFDLSDSYVPHSLRHGGATRLHLQGMPIEDIMLRGRWISNKSARTYIQAGRAMLLAITVPSKLMEVGGQLAKELVASISLSQSH